MPQLGPILQLMFEIQLPLASRRRARCRHLGRRGILREGTDRSSWGLGLHPAITGASDLGAKTMTFHGSMHLREGLTPSWLLFAALICAPLAADGTQPAGATPGDQTALTELVEAYFQSPDPDDRRSLVGKINAGAEGSIDTVVGTLGSVQLWQVPDDNAGTFDLMLASGETLKIGYDLPNDYDPMQRYPTVICMPDRGWSQKDCLFFTSSLVGESAGAFITLGPDRPLDGSFSREAAEHADVRRFLREVRRRFHIDTDRTYLFGPGFGGDAAWMTAVACPNEFAGAISVNAYLRVPYPEQLYRLLLGNLRTLPVLRVWWGDVIDSPGPVRERAIAAHNRAILAIATQEGLPITGKEVPSDSNNPEAAAGALREFSKELRIILAKRRPAPNGNVTHWFRYPDQGDAGWVRLTKFKGDVWEEEQLSILPSPVTDRDEYITAIIEEKLGYIGATVQGQTINIETRKCGKIDIIFPLGLVDLDKPVTIYCNGRRRHNGPVRSSIRTLLETTYDTWDFQRLTPARLPLSIKSERGD